MQYSCRMYILRALHRSGFSERRARPQWLQEINNRKTPFFYQTVKEPLSGQRNGTGPPLPRRHSDVSLYEEVSVCWWKWKTPTVKQVNEGEFAELESAALLWKLPSQWCHSRCFQSAANGKTPAEPVTSLTEARLEAHDASNDANQRW